MDKGYVDSRIFSAVDCIVRDTQYTIETKMSYPFVDMGNYTYMREMVRAIIEEWLEEKALEEKARLEAGGL